MAMSETLERRQKQRLEAAFAKTELRGQRLALMVRTVALVVIGVWLVVSLANWAVAYYLLIITVALTAGMGRWLVLGGRHDGPWASTALILLDAGVMAWAFLVPNPFDAIGIPAPVQLRFGSFIYFFVFLAGLALTHSARLVLGFGALAATAWAIGVAWILDQPGSYTLGRNAMTAHGSEAWLATYLDPYFVDLVAESQRLVALVLASAILAVAAWQSRELARREVAAERQRAGLARYFSPNMIDELVASADGPGQVRAQSVAVLFIDIVGFTRLAESQAPEAVIALLRDFDARVTTTVFEHRGTLDKFLGDGAMATFGTPRAGPRDATNAAACAIALLGAVASMNEARRSRGEEPVSVGIGVHYGPVVVGDVGDERRLEFAVVGDTVNVASRLERSTRRLGTALLVSEALVEAMRREDAESVPASVVRFERAAILPIRGREGRVPAWKLRDAER